MPNRKTDSTDKYVLSLVWFLVGVMLLLTSLLHSINSLQVLDGNWLLVVSIFSLIGSFCWTLGIGYMWLIRAQSKRVKIIAALLIIMPILSLTLYSLFAFSFVTERWINQTQGFVSPGTIFGMAVITWLRTDV